MRTFTQTRLIYIYLLIDIVLLNLGLELMDYFNANVDLFDFEHPAKFVNYILHANLSWLITYLSLSKQNVYLRDGLFNRFRRISLRTGIFILVGLVIAELFMPKNFSRYFFFEYTFLFYMLKMILYAVFYSILDYRRRRDLNVNRALIVGVNDTSLKLKLLIDHNPVLGFKFIGFVSDYEVEGYDLLGKTKDIARIIVEQNIEMIFVSFSIFGKDRITKDYLKICNRLGVRMRFVPDNQRWLKSKANLESVGNIVLINPQEIPLDDLYSRFLKRSFDLLFSLSFILIVFSWLFPIIAIIIKLSSKGPVFFIQKRTGANNKPFCCLKFRSMYVNDQADTLQATINDARITPIGRFMRRTNIDELPQFLNVFIGQMSVVGPRPHMLEHTEEYSKLIDEYLVRHYVKPGVTGWAQINGFRGVTDELWKMEKRVEYDMEYIRNWSFWWDLRIVFSTTFNRKTFENAG
jgi:putative colanic acid biosysnthesis UDP-glucose lipid carrier transferase